MPTLPFWWCIGDEHGEALQRREHHIPDVCPDCNPPDTDSAPIVRRRSTNEKSNGYAAGPGKADKVRRDIGKSPSSSPPGAPGSQGPGPGHEAASPLHRRYADVRGEGHDGSDLDPNQPGQKSEHTLAKSFHVDTVEELKSIIHDQNREEMIQFYKTHGHVHCDGTNSETCNHTVCELGAPSCRPFTKKEKAKYARQSDELTFKVLSTGKCDPNIEANKDICNEFGYCDVFKLNGHPQTDCQSLTPQKDYFELLSHLEWQDDSGSFVYRKDLQPGSTHEDSSDHSHSGEADGHMTGHLSKRAVSMVESLLARDVVRPEPGGKEPPSAGADDNQSSLVKIVKRFEMHLLENRMGSGTSMNSQTDMSEISKQLEEYLQDAAKTTGWCSEESRTCRLHYCDLGTPDCQHIRTDQAKQQFFDDASRMFEVVYSFGKCTPAADNTDTCSKQGWCINSNYPNPTPGCEKLSTSELPKVYEEIKNSPSVSAYPPGFSPALPGTSGQDGRGNEDALNQDQPDKQEIHEFMELCKRLSRDNEALEMVAESAGITDPDVIEGLREQFAYLAIHRSWAIEAIKQAKVSQMLAESKLQAGRFGQKGGSEDKPESDDDDKHAHVDKVNDGARAGSKWKRDMAGGPDERVPGYETVTFRPEDSQFHDYEPTKHEIRQFMRLCKQLSHDRAALEEVAHAAEIEDESMIEELREQFAYLAKHRDAAIETIKNAKEAQMIGESKLQTQRFGQKDGSDGDAGDKADNGDGYHGRWTRSNDSASPSGKGDHDAESR